MKRGVLGAALLAVLLFAGILSTRSIRYNYAPIEQTLQQAAQAATDEDWPQARELTREAAQLWHNQRSHGSVFSDHSPLEQIDLLLSRLEVWNQAEDAPRFTDLCAQLIRELSALTDAHALTWENLL